MFVSSQLNKYFAIFGSFLLCAFVANFYIGQCHLQNVSPYSVTRNVSNESKARLHSTVIESNEKPIREKNNNLTGLNGFKRINNVNVTIRMENSSLPRCPSVTGRRILINFGSTCCKNSQVINCKSGLEIGGFDLCISFGPESLDRDFTERCLTPLLKPIKRGYGYWVWKPYIILKYVPHISINISFTFFFIFRTLLEMNDDDYLFYADAGSEFIDNVDTGLICPFHELGRDIQLFHLDRKENAYTKEDAFTLTGCNTKECRESNQITGSFILLRRTMKSIRFVSEWLAFATDRRAVSDQPSILGKDGPAFKTHRHDQSLLSLVAKKWGFFDQVLPDPSQWGDSDRKKLTPRHGFKNIQFINHTRRKI